MKTVAELIAELQQFDQSLPVVVSGFDESGYEDIGTVEVITIRPIQNTGIHCPAYNNPDATPHWTTFTGEPFTAVWIDM